jgi:ABC-2 type transport system ATP-binding protein
MTETAQANTKREVILNATGLHKTFYTGFFGSLPVLKKIKIGRLHKVVEAVRGVDLEVRRGEVFAFLGGNGAGKSTTMKMLMGLIKPTRGSATLQGVDVSRAQARTRVGYLPENPTFYDELTPLELLDFYGALQGMSPRDRQREAKELLGRVGLSHALKRPLRKLSKGMHQRVGIAQALLNTPDLLILDEPLSGLDPIGRREIREVLLTERDRGATLFFSSHILPDVEALSDRFALIEAGRVKHSGDLREVRGSTTQVELCLQDPSEACQSALSGLNIDDPSAVNSAGDIRNREGWTIKIPIERQPRALELIAEHRAILTRLTPLRPSLESLFDHTPQAHIDREERL